MTRLKIKAVCHPSRKTIDKGLLAAFEGGSYTAAFEPAGPEGEPRLVLRFSACPELRAGPLLEWLQGDSDDLSQWGLNPMHASEMLLTSSARDAGRALETFVRTLHQLDLLAVPLELGLSYAQRQLDVIHLNLRKPTGGEHDQPL